MDTKGNKRGRNTGNTPRASLNRCVNGRIIKGCCNSISPLCECLPIYNPGVLQIRSNAGLLGSNTTSKWETSSDGSSSVSSDEVNWEEEFDLDIRRWISGDGGSYLKNFIFCTIEEYNRKQSEKMIEIPKKEDIVMK